MDVLEISMMIHDANKNLRSLFKENYDEKAEPIREVIRRFMKQENVSTLVALTKILQRLQARFGEDSRETTVNTLWFCAAAVDVINEQAKS